jgi:O-antigen ligase
LLPLVVAVVLWKGGKGLEATWLLVGAAWLMAVGAWRKKSFAVSPFLWMPLLGFVVWTALSLLWSSTPNYGLDELLRDGSLAVIFLVGVGRNDGSRDVRRFLIVLGLVAAVAALIGVVIYALQPVNRFVGTFVDWRFHTDYWPNAWAQFLLLAWPAGVWWMLEAQGKVRRVGAVLVGVLLGALLLSYSRGALIAFGGQVTMGVGCVLWMHAGALRNLPIRRAAWWTLTIGVTAAVVFLSANALRARTFPVQSVADKVTFSADEGTSSVSERRQFWDVAIDMARQRPLLGWGPYSFRFVHPSSQTAVLATSDHPHNLFLKFAAERGVPAAIFFLLFLCAVAMVGVKGIRVARMKRDDSVVRTQCILLIAVAGVLAHNLIDYNLQFVGIALPWWMAMGFFAGTSRKGVTPSVAEGRIFPRYLPLFISTILLVIALLETPPMIFSSLGRHAEAAGRVEDALRWYEAADGQWLSRDMELSKTQLLLRDGHLDEAESAIDAFQKRNAQDSRAWSIRSDIAEAKGDWSLALDATSEAYKRNRWNDVGLLARWLRLNQRLQMNRVSQEEALQLLRAFAAAIDSNAHFIALGPNPEAFQEAASAVIEMYPDVEPELRVLTARVARRTAEERAKLSARVPGMLW